MVCAVKKYKLILVMPESMPSSAGNSWQLRRDLELTPREGGMKAAIQKATDLVNARPTPGCRGNSRTKRISKPTGAARPRKSSRIPRGLDYVITGVGTGGHITALAEVLKERFKGLKVLAVEPAASPVISGGKPGPHPLQGLGAGFHSRESARGSPGRIIQVTKEEAFEYAVRCSREEGILVGISSGAALAAVAQKLPEIREGSRVLTFCYDTGERYLSIDELFR